MTIWDQDDNRASIFFGGAARTADDHIEGKLPVGDIVYGEGIVDGENHWEYFLLHFLKRTSITSMLRRQILKAPMSRPYTKRYEIDEVKASGTVEDYALSRIHYYYNELNFIA